jgi:HEPN domain-containing protein
VCSGTPLVVLVDSLADQLADAQVLRTLAAELDLHYVPARYPNGLPDLAPFQAYSQEQAKRAIDAAERILETVRGRVELPG